jgi:hypothetical protein
MGIEPGCCGQCCSRDEKYGGTHGKCRSSGEKDELE